MTRHSDAGAVDQRWHCAGTAPAAASTGTAPAAASTTSAGTTPAPRRHRAGGGIDQCAGSAAAILPRHVIWQLPKLAKNWPKIGQKTP